MEAEVGVVVDEEELPSLHQGGRWLTVDGPLGMQDQDAACKQARNFFYAGFALLPWLWLVNCFYFWPVLRHRHHNPDSLLRSYVVRSAIGFTVYSSLLLTWALTFAIGGVYLGLACVFPTVALDVEAAFWELKDWRM